MKELPTQSKWDNRKTAPLTNLSAAYNSILLRFKSNITCYAGIKKKK